MAAKNKAQVRADAVEEIGDDPVPKDMDEFRFELARRIHVFIANREQLWRSCRERACRRAHSCQTQRRVPCSNRPPSPPRDPEKWPEVAAKIRRVLDRLNAMTPEEREAQRRLIAKRDAARSRKSPNPISRPRRGSQCASRTP